MEERITDDSVTQEVIQALRRSSRMGRKIVYFEETDSTSTQARLLANGEDWDGTLVVAEMQNHGKGRRGRGWSSPKGSGIWMSLLIKPEISPGKVSPITLVAALAVHRALRKICPGAFLIKWPNDIVADGKKLCGILTETESEGDCINYVVMGIGINVNNTSFPEEISKTATSISEVFGHAVKRAPIVADFLAEFEGLYEEFERSKDLSPMIEEYKGCLANMDRRVRILEPENEWEGIARGINERGELLVENENGKMICVVSGEVSVRGIYGYI